MRVRVHNGIKSSNCKDLGKGKGYTWYEVG